MMAPPRPGIKMLGALRRSILGGEAGRLGYVLGGVDVEERIDRTVGPFGERDAVARGPYLDLAQSVMDERVAQVLAQRNRPQPDHRMPPRTRLRASERGVGARACLVQPGNDVARQERA